MGTQSDIHRGKYNEYVRHTDETEIDTTRGEAVLLENKPYQEMGDPRNWQIHHDNLVRLKKSGKLDPDQEWEYEIFMKMEKEGHVKPLSDWPTWKKVLAFIGATVGFVALEYGLSFVYTPELGGSFILLVLLLYLLAVLGIFLS
jgi:hypothetical protein